EREEAERREQVMKVQALEGTWKDKDTGLSYRVTISGSQFEAVSADGLRVRGILRGSSLDGTVTWRGGREDRYGCNIPSAEEAMTGSIEQDGRSLILRTQVPHFQWWGKTEGLLLPKQCHGVNRTGAEPALIILVR